MRPPCAPEGARSEREGAPHDARGRARAAPTPPRPSQVLREQEGVRGYAELQSKNRATYGDDEEAREAAGRAALFRAKESLSTGLQPAGRYALAVSSEGALRLRCSASSVACASRFKPLYRRESDCVREREPRERGQGFRACQCVRVWAKKHIPPSYGQESHTLFV